MEKRLKLWFAGMELHLFMLCLLLAQGCNFLDQNGIAKDDEAAHLCGFFGLVAFVAGIAGRDKSIKLVIVGVLLILA